MMQTRGHERPQFHRRFIFLVGFMAGKIFMSMFVSMFSIEIAFSVVYVYSAELFALATQLATPPV